MHDRSAPRYNVPHDLADRVDVEVGVNTEGMSLFSVKQVALLLGVSFHTLDSWIRAGRVPQPYKAGRARGFARHQLQTIAQAGIRPARTFPRQLTRGRNTTGIGPKAVRTVSERTRRKHAADTTQP